MRSKAIAALEKASDADARAAGRGRATSARPSRRSRRDSRSCARRIGSRATTAPRGSKRSRNFRAATTRRRACCCCRCSRRTRTASFREPDAELRAAAERAIRAIDGSQRKGELAGAVFTGISLGSVLLLAALGLAITYGLMGVINMAHGEFLMIGAYTTFVVQNAFRQHAPGAFDWYLAAALPAAFACAFVVGVVIERTRRALSVRPTARDAARDLRPQPAADPGDAHAVRRPERRGREPVVDERRHPAAAEPDPAVEPHLHHRVRARRRRAGVGACST